jgi:hypothetical protein
MDSNRADSIRVLTMEDFLVLGFDVVYLVGVARCENDNVIFKVMQVETLV